MVVNLSIAVHELHLRMLTSLSVDEILLLRYMNWSTNFRGLILNVEMTPRNLFYLSSRRDYCLLMPATGFATELRLDHVYLREAFDRIKITLISVSSILFYQYILKLFCLSFVHLLVTLIYIPSPQPNEIYFTLSCDQLRYFL